MIENAIIQYNRVFIEIEDFDNDSSVPCLFWCGKKFIDAKTFFDEYHDMDIINCSLDEENNCITLYCETELPSHILDSLPAFTVKADSNILIIKIKLKK